LVSAVYDPRVTSYRSKKRTCGRDCLYANYTVPLCRIRAISTYLPMQHLIIAEMF
jgi:hypothetical protein